MATLCLKGHEIFDPFCKENSTTFAWNFSFSLIAYPYPIGSAKNNGEETLSALNIKYVEQACNLFI